MELDEQQKQEFINYWGGCPLADKMGNVVFADGVDHLGAKDQIIFGTAWVREREPNGEWRKDAHGNLRLHNVSWTGTKFEELTPIFVDPGYYQTYPSETHWISRRPERGMIKGMSRGNTSFLSIRPFSEKMKQANFYNSEYDIRSICRIHYGALKYLRESDVEEAILKQSPLEKGYSFALSKNVALINHKDFGIPVVMYKLNPVGYYLDGKVLLSKKKDVSKETIEEETRFNVEIYEE